MKYKIGVLIVVTAVALVGFRVFVSKKDNPTIPSQTTSPSDQTQPKEPKKPPIINLQPTVDEWAKKQSGSASVVVIDLANNKTVASLNADKTYFSASLYKLFVAYEGYQKVADGTYKMNDPYLDGYTRGKCLDEMIRSSYSPCGEKMWNELGKQNITNKLKTYGIKSTNMVGLQTTARDSAKLLQRLYEKRDLNQQHTDLYLDSLKNQPAKYRIGLPSGFSNSTVYNKVGWNLDLEWHDAAIVTLKNGRSYVVSVLTNSVGRANIVELAKAIEAKLD